MGFEIPIDVDYFDHPKTLKLIATLGREEADIYPLRLWRWAAKYARDGVIRGGARAVEVAVGWRGRPGRLHAALVEAELLAYDGTSAISTIHDWHEGVGRAIAIYDEKRRKQREKYHSPKKNLPEEFRRSSGRIPPILDTLDTLDVLDKKEHPPALLPEESSKPEKNFIQEAEALLTAPVLVRVGRGETVGDEIESQLYALARRQHINAKEETLRTYLRGWIRQKGAKEVERILSCPEVVGKSLIAVQGRFFDTMSTGFSAAAEDLKRGGNR